MIQKKVPIEIEVNPSTKPRIPPVVAFPGDEVSFSSIKGDSTFFFPEGDQIFEQPESRTFTVGSEQTVSRRIKSNVVDDQVFEKTIGTRGVRFVEYAVSCKNDDGIYFAEGNSAPKIIIPRFP